MSTVDPDGDGSAPAEMQSIADVSRTHAIPAWDIVQIITIVAQQLDASAVHGVVAPENILINSAGDAVLRETHPTADNTLFSSPEQLRDLPLNARSDQYSLACSAFALLTGSAPYTGSSTTAVALAHGQDPAPSAHARNRSLPPAVDPVFQRALAKQPSDRFPDSQTFAAALSAAMRGVPAAEVRRRPTAPVIVGALIVVAAVVAGITTFVLTRPDDTSSTPPPSPVAVVAGDTGNFCAAHAGDPLACGDDVDEPKVVPGLTGVSGLWVSSGTTCAIATGQVYCWGGNSDGQLGTGQASDTPVTTPQPVPGMSKTTSITGLGDSVCAVNDSDVYCWGDLRTWMPVGNVPFPAPPQKIPGLAGATAVSGNWWTTCAIVAESAWCWGKNDLGQTGDRRGAKTTTPTRVEGLGRVTAISVQNDNSCAISDGTPWCWGNINQLLGEKLNSRPHPVPVQIPGFDKLTGISVSTKSVFGDPSPSTPGTFETVGATFLCGITERRTVMCAGYNGDGQLGTGDTAPSASPVTVPGVAGATALMTDYDHACAITTELQCWGLVYGYGDIWKPRAVVWPR